MSFIKKIKALYILGKFVSIMSSFHRNIYIYIYIIVKLSNNLELKYRAYKG